MGDGLPEAGVVKKMWLIGWEWRLFPRWELYGRTMDRAPLWLFFGYVLLLEGPGWVGLPSLLWVYPPVAWYYAFAVTWLDLAGSVL